MFSIPLVCPSVFKRLWTDFHKIFNYLSQRTTSHVFGGDLANQHPAELCSTNHTLAAVSSALPVICQTGTPVVVDEEWGVVAERYLTNAMLNPPMLWLHSPLLIPEQQNFQRWCEVNFRRQVICKQGGASSSANTLLGSQQRCALSKCYISSISVS